MRRVAALILAVTLSIYWTPALLAAPQTGAISGVAHTSGGAAAANQQARLRSVRTGGILMSTPTSSLGGFEFSNVAAGSYVVEIVDLAGKVVGISGVTTVSGGSTAVAAITVATPVAGGAIAAPLIALLIAAGGAGAVGIWAATKEDASPSK